MRLSDFRTHLLFLLRLALYFAVLGMLLMLIFDSLPGMLGAEDFAENNGEITQTFIESLFESSGQPPSLAYSTAAGRLAVLGVLAFFFLGTVALMLPITWVYMYTHPNSYRRSLVTALLIMPICATATVWLIQDSLPLAFGLAALVAAVRFRIRLDNPLDGVYVFCAISVGLASGVGHLDVGFVMALFFSFCATLVWIARYGKRPHAAEPPQDPRVSVAQADAHLQSSPRQAP